MDTFLTIIRIDIITIQYSELNGLSLIALLGFVTKLILRTHYVGVITFDDRSKDNMIR